MLWKRKNTLSNEQLTAIIHSWKNISASWENLYEKAFAGLEKSNSLLLANAVVNPNSNLKEYAELISNLIKAVNEIYIVPKSGVGSVEVSKGEELIHNVIKCNNALIEKLKSDGL